MASASCKLMWHEARQQEKFIQKLLVDYRKRAERRKAYYEKIKLEPMQFLQVHGRSMKVHMDPAIYMAAEAPGTMLPWRGDNQCMIDRFDVRAHLDELPAKPPDTDSDDGDKAPDDPPPEWEDRQINYERFRTLVQNNFMDIAEEKFLQQIRSEELYGPLGNKSTEDDKRERPSKKAAIGFSYENDTPSLPGSISSIPLPSSHAGGATKPKHETLAVDDKLDSDDDSDSDIDLDMTVDVMQLSNEQQQFLNTAGMQYGLKAHDFMDLISRDLQEADELRQVKQIQDEKALLSGRKSRKERRALRKKTVDKKNSPPSYAARSSPTYQPYRKHSSSRSPSGSPPPPAATGKIKFITSFGGDSDGGSDKEDGVTGVIILPKESSSKSRRHDRDRKKNRWDQTSTEKERHRDRGSRDRDGRGSRDRDGRGSRDVDGRRSRDRDRYTRDRGGGSSSRGFDRQRGDRDRRRYHDEKDTNYYHQHSAAGGGVDRDHHRYRGNRDIKSSGRSVSSSMGDVRQPSSAYSRRSRSGSGSRRVDRSPGSFNAHARSRDSDRNSSSKRKRPDGSRSKSPPRFAAPESIVSKAMRGSASPGGGGNVMNPAPAVSSSSSSVAPIRRYYGRRGGDTDEDDDSDADDADAKLDQSSKTSSTLANTGAAAATLSTAGVCGGDDGAPSLKATAGVGAAAAVSRKDKLKKKMQALLKKQYKADKQQERERLEKQQQERLDREEELREISIKMRRREREKRHRRHGSSSSWSRSTSRSLSPPPLSPRMPYPRRSRSSSLSDGGSRRDKSGSSYRAEDERIRNRRGSRSPQHRRGSGDGGRESRDQRPGLLPSPELQPPLLEPHIPDMRRPPPPYHPSYPQPTTGDNSRLCPTPPGISSRDYRDHPGDHRSNNNSRGGSGPGNRDYRGDCGNNREYRSNSGNRGGYDGGAGNRDYQNDSGRDYRDRIGGGNNRDYHEDYRGSDNSRDYPRGGVGGHNPLQGEFRGEREDYHHDSDARREFPAAMMRNRPPPLMPEREMERVLYGGGSVRDPYIARDRGRPPPGSSYHRNTSNGNSYNRDRGPAAAYSNRDDNSNDRGSSRWEGGGEERGGHRGSREQQQRRTDEQQRHSRQEQRDYDNKSGSEGARQTVKLVDY